MKARTIKREAQKRLIRAAKQGNARRAIGDLEKGCEVFILTFGQFSLLDAIVAVLEQTGPADVTLSTWTAGGADLTRAAELLKSDLMTDFRMIVDRSFVGRQPAYCRSMRKLFGDESIRTARLHSKFALIRNANWSIAIRTSMNMNENPRLENIEISDCASLHDFLEQVADEIFDEQPAGKFDGEIPTLPGIVNSGTPSVRAGRLAVEHLRPATGGPR